MSSIILFEISWEVSNLVGGIHTVLASKLNQAKKYANSYYTLGPYKNTEEFESQDLPGLFIPLYEELKQIGITIHYGKWITNNQEANTLLVELTGFESQANHIKAKLWEQYQIDSLNTNWFDFDEVMTWSWACGIVCEKITQQLNPHTSIIHTHEWMSSGAVFYIDTAKQENKLKQNIKTVFTTHATMLGRAYYGTYDKLLVHEKEVLKEKTPYEIAQELNVHTKYQTELKALETANAATCVSSLLKDEIKALYFNSNVKVTENGFDNNISFDDCISEFVSIHSKLTDDIQDYFSSYYKVKKNMRIGIISGRFEIKAKGYDLTFEALGKLNTKLQQQDSSKDIVILAPIIAGNYQELETEQTLDFNSNIAPLSKHNIEIEHPLMQLCFNNKLLNRKEDKVKIILIPRIVSSDKPYFNSNYYQLLKASDFSLFPSGYEPWGYTPHESIASGVVTLTSNCAGFGAYWQKMHINNSIVKIASCSDHQAKILQIQDFIEEEYKKTSQTQYREKKYALEYAKELSWSVLYDKYRKIYEELVLK